MSRRARLWLIILVLVLCVALDQVSKEIARRYLSTAAPISIWNDLIHLEYGENPGAFLGLGSTWPPTVRFIFGVLVVAIVVVVSLGYAIAEPELSTTQWMALALVAAGGIGNLIDRVTQQGIVSDFIRLGIGRVHTGVFNVADVAVMVGVGLLMLSSFRTGPQPTPTPPSPDSA